VRALVILVQILVSAFLTASLMPFILVSVPAAAQDQRVGISCMVGLLILSFAGVSLVWPGRARGKRRP
jgi:hypothetical protein